MVVAHHFGMRRVTVDQDVLWIACGAAPTNYKRKECGPDVFNEDFDQLA